MNDLEKTKEICETIKSLPINEAVELLNAVRELLHEVSPFKSEPVDLIRWIPVMTVKANDYNPNKVAPPEMELLRHSINHDGYTQPVVTWETEKGREVIDGFHRSRVCREFEDVNRRVHGFLPCVTIRNDCEDLNDRMAATIRHNRARGKHRVEAMSDIVMELKRRRWNDAKIAKELGMESDEVLRLCQVSGIAAMFEDSEFTEAWEPETMMSVADSINEDEVLNGKD